MKEETYPYVMHQLPYEYDDLLPVLAEEVLKFHHDKHYRTYVDNLNEALSDYPELQRIPLHQLLEKLPFLPEAVQRPVRRNGGGVLAHELYFDSMKGRNDTDPEGYLKESMIRDFGTMKQWKEKMKAAAFAQFGSGWVFLVTDTRGSLSIINTDNTELPDLRKYEPILALDLWEHAYYLQYQNRRSAYVEEWFRLINWEAVGKRYEEAFHGKVRNHLSGDEKYSESIAVNTKENQ